LQEKREELPLLKTICLVLLLLREAQCLREILEQGPGDFQIRLDEEK
jgi:hypothetical protein